MSHLELTPPGHADQSTHTQGSSLRRGGWAADIILNPLEVEELELRQQVDHVRSIILERKDRVSDQTADKDRSEIRTSVQTPSSTHTHARTTCVPHSPQPHELGARRQRLERPKLRDVVVLQVEISQVRDGLTQVGCNTAANLDCEYCGFKK